MQRKIYNTPNGVFISLETKEFVLNLKRHFKTRQAAEKALGKMIYRLFREPEKFIVK